MWSLAARGWAAELRGLKDLGSHQPLLPSASIGRNPQRLYRRRPFEDCLSWNLFSSQLKKCIQLVISGQFVKKNNDLAFFESNLRRMDIRGVELNEIHVDSLAPWGGGRSWDGSGHLQRTIGGLGMSEREGKFSSQFASQRPRHSQSNLHLVEHYDPQILFSHTFWQSANTNICFY